MILSALFCVRPMIRVSVYSRPFIYKFVLCFLLAELCNVCGFLFAFSSAYVDLPHIIT